MTVLELYQFLNQRISPALSCEWDNDGLMCCPEPGRRVRKVLLALDITEAVVEKAVAEGYDVILSHHPLIFRPVKALTPEAGVPRKLIRLVQAGISAMSFHTRLDAVTGGVNDVLANLLDLKKVSPFGPEGEEMGRIGELRAPCEVTELARRVKELLEAPAVLVSGGGTVSRVAVLGGNGDDFVEAARAAGAQVLISGRLGYHPMTDAPESGLCLIEAGHYFTEQPVLSVLASLVQEAQEDVETCVAKSFAMRLI